MATIDVEKEAKATPQPRLTVTPRQCDEKVETKDSTHPAETACSVCGGPVS